MTVVSRFLLVILAGLLLSLTGCLPPPTGSSNEEKEPYFRKGDELDKARDVSGAMDAFEKALEVNPRNSLAHYRLGLLSERDDPATAMYHYSRFLKDQPEPALAEKARERITVCRTALAQSVALSMVPSTKTLQAEIERLTIANRELAQKNDAWARWAATQARQISQPPPADPPMSPLNSVPPANPSGPGAGSSLPQPHEPTASPPTPPATRQESERGPAPPAAPARRTHVIRSGDTPSSIAKRYGVSLNALMQANPRVEARKLKPGQSLVIPEK